MVRAAYVGRFVLKFLTYFPRLRTTARHGHGRLGGRCTIYTVFYGHVYLDRPYIQAVDGKKEFIVYSSRVVRVT